MIWDTFGSFSGQELGVAVRRTSLAYFPGKVDGSPLAHFPGRKYESKFDGISKHVEGVIIS